MKHNSVIISTQILKALYLNQLFSHILIPFQQCITHFDWVQMVYRSGSLAPVIPCCLRATRHYLDQCWSIIKGFSNTFVWEWIHKRRSRYIFLDSIWIYLLVKFFKIIAISLRGQWVKMHATVRKHNEIKCWYTNRFSYCVVLHKFMTTNWIIFDTMFVRFSAWYTILSWELR